MITDCELEFEQVRSGTLQWEVKYKDKVVARVTHRVIANRPYIINHIIDGKDGKDIKCDTRYEVIQIILAHLNKVG